MSSVVYEPPPVHRCPPERSNSRFWRTYNEAARTYAFEFAQRGTVRACECGRTWVALPPQPGLTVTVWRPEGRFERWRRLRRKTVVPAT